MEATTPRLRPFGTTIFARMSALATATGAVNLGQGFPDEDGPADVVEAAVAALREGRGNQYPPGPGIPELRSAVAAHQRMRYGIELDPDTEVLVTAGATEGIAATALGLLGPGDEAVLLEPYYDSYAAAVALAGATRRSVPLRRDATGFRLEADALGDAVTPRTRLLVVNSPHNPTGTVLGAAERAAVAAVAERHDLVVLADEVYEHLVYPPATHRPLATEPGLAGRTITLGSAGKTFSFTGWKIGWATGPADLIAAVRAAKQWLTYTSGGPLQHAAAYALDTHTTPGGWPDRLRATLAERSALLATGLRDLGLEVVPAAAGYFVVTDVSALLGGGGWPGGATDGASFAEELPGLAGLVAIPVAPFCDDPATGRMLVRWACCKRPEVLAEGLGRLAAVLR